MELPRIVLVEHDPAAQMVIELTLRQRVPSHLTVCRYGYELEEMLRASPTAQPANLLIIDLNLSDADGLELIQEMRRRYPDMPVIATASVRNQAQIEAVMQAGATDFIRKSDEPARIATLIRTVLNTATTASRRDSAEDAEAIRITAKGPFASIIGRSEALNQAIQQALQAADSDIPVLIHGESGVGKERMALAIHEASRRARKPFVAVNCGAIAPNLIESTLFGHVKGAFTGATSDAPGMFRQADGGTLFLDEVGELPLSAQVSLLRALQESQVQPVGGSAAEPVNVRIISATHVDLEAAIRDGRFREDLYYRLHVFPVELPPLRQRGKADIVMLIQHFIRRYALLEDKQIDGITEAAVALLTAYSWPGNVRQLENAVYRAVVLASEAKLRAEDFVQISNALYDHQLNGQKLEIAGRMAAADGGGSLRSERSDRPVVELLTEAEDFRSLREIEMEVLKKALLHYRWRITDIAQALGVTRATVYKKMREAGLHDPRKAG